MDEKEPFSLEFDTSKRCEWCGHAYALAFECQRIPGEPIKTTRICSNPDCPGEPDPYADRLKHHVFEVFDARTNARKLVIEANWAGEAIRNLQEAVIALEDRLARLERGEDDHA